MLVSFVNHVTEIKGDENTMSRLFVIIIIFIMLFSCSEKRDIADVKVGPHPEGWVAANDAGEHGNYLEENGFNLNSCKSCHGEDCKNHQLEYTGMYPVSWRKLRGGNERCKLPYLSYSG